MIGFLTADEFQSQKREEHLEFDSYLEEADDLCTSYLAAQQNLSNPEWIAKSDAGTRMMVAAAAAEFSADLLTLSYSAGVSLEELRAFFPSIVEAWVTNDKYQVEYDQSPRGESSTTATYALLGDDFEIVNRVVCLGILLGWGELLRHVARIIAHKNPRMDGMLERMLSYYVPNRDSSIAECTRHLPYVKTLTIFDSSPDLQPAMMAEYLGGWYASSRRERYYDSHKRGHGFKGYWSWEAAAITFLLNIDDSNYRSSEFYPADLVDFARRAKLDEKSANPLNAEANELRLKAGDSCPKSGTWQSIDIPSTAKVFNGGEIAPDLGSRYGLTVWQYAK
jgi:hypothetical protein